MSFFFWLIFFLFTLIHFYRFLYLINYIITFARLPSTSSNFFFFLLNLITPLQSILLIKKKKIDRPFFFPPFPHENILIFLRTNMFSDISLFNLVDFSFYLIYKIVYLNLSFLNKILSIFCFEIYFWKSKSE